MIVRQIIKFSLCLSMLTLAGGVAHAQDIVPNDSSATTFPATVPAGVSDPASVSGTAASGDAKDMPFDLVADNVSYDVSGSKVTATGDGMNQVHIKSAKGQVWADRIDYDLKNSGVVAVGNVKFVNPDSTTLIVQKLQLTGDMQKGALNQLRLRLPALGEIAQAGSAKVSGTTYTMTDVVYSPCKECIGDEKPWTLKADRMVYDRDKGTMTYNNAVVDVYGKPVMYLPWFRHPIGPKQAEDGLLPPQFGRSENLGENVTLGGYVFNPAENADYTIRDRIMTDRGNQIQLQRRQSTLTTDSDIQASYLNDTETGTVRNSLKIDAEKDFSTTQRIGLNGEIASDDTYLQQYFDRLDPYLASTLYGEDAGDQHYAALSFTRFQDFDPTHPSANTAQILPHLQLEKWFVPSFGGQTDFSADAVNVYRSEGVQDRRLVTEADYTKPVMLDDGSKLTLGAQARMDFYVIDNGAANGTVTRALPEATAMWEKPYISPGGTHTIAPQVLLAISPRGGNSSDKVPNEDSASYELDTTNLFEPSRFSGLDRVETGPRMVYGLDNRWGSPDRTDLRVFVGQSIRKFDDATLPPSSGASTNNSDWVALVESNPYDWLSFTNRSRFDNATFVARRLDSGLQLGKTDGAYLRVTHSYLDGGPQELSTELSVPLTDQIDFKGKTRDDLATSTLLESQGGIVWTRDCYALEAYVRRRGYTNGDLQPGTDYIVNLRLLTLGSDD